MEFIAVVVFTLLLAAANAASSGVFLDSDEKFEVSWTFDGTEPSDEIEFTVSIEYLLHPPLGLSLHL